MEIYLDHKKYLDDELGGKFRKLLYWEPKYFVEFGQVLQVRTSNGIQTDCKKMIYLTKDPPSYHITCKMFSGCKPTYCINTCLD